MLTPIPAGIVPEKAALYAYFALLSNANSYCGQMVDVTTAGTNSTLTAAQAIARVVHLLAGASGGFTVTLPATSVIISALGPTIPTDGTYGQPFSILNDGVGQTGTLTAGDASTTITGTATALTDTRRDFFLTVTSPTTITIQNMGSAAI